MTGSLIRKYGELCLFIMLIEEEEYHFEIAYLRSWAVRPCGKRNCMLGEMNMETEIVFSEEIQGKLALDDVQYTEEQLKESYNGIYNRYLKRVIDFCLALLGIVVTFPIVLIISVLIAMETGFPVLYRPQRGGYKGRTFRICKFRTMVKNADKIGGGTTALNDSRITRVGAFLRKTKLDEFPQLFNVLFGDSGIIGTTKKKLDFSRVVTVNSVLL